jgi:hypothetical protein
MRRFMSKKAVGIGVVAALLLGGGVAFAIVSGTGSGTGSGTTTAGGGPALNVALSVHFNGTTPLVPGGSIPVTFDATNANASPALIKTISLDTSSSTAPDGVSSTNAGCEAFLQAYNRNIATSPAGQDNQFTLPTVTINTSVPAGATDYGLIPQGTLSWINLPMVDQGPCLSQPLTLHVTTP